MGTQPSKEQGNLNYAEQPADIENACGSVGSAPSQSGGAQEISEEEAERHYYRPLLQAAFKGDWEFAKRFFDGDSASKTAKLTSRSETALHIAALSAQDQFVENLVELLSPYPELLEMVDCDGSTALHNAVLCGRIRMVKAFVRSNPNLTQLPDKMGRVPLDIAAVEASMHKEIAWFLAKSTTHDGPSHRPFSSPSALETVIALTLAGHHDITLYLVERCPHLITQKKKKEYGYRATSILDALARMRSHFPSGTRLSILEALMYKCIPVDLNYKPTDKNADPALQCLTRSLWSAIKIVVPIVERVYEVKLRHMAVMELAKQCCIAISTMNTTEITDFFQEGGVLYQATVLGISEIVKLCIQFFPELIRIPHYDMRLTTLAVRSRQERTFGLFLKVRATNELSLVPGPSREESDRMMRVAARYHPSFDAITDVAGAAFQMQRELQWYKAVESCVIPSVRTVYYWEGDKTGWNLFVENHKELLEKGERWMKDTSDKCMLVSTLIATVLFAAAFTVPGGNDDKTGVPLLLGQDSVLVFAISDALGLVSSVMAILLFLAILTSRYEPQDFLASLPKRIIMGLCFLFLSLAFMLVAFAATLKIVLDKRLEWVLIPIALLSSLPVALFVVLQLPLLYHMVKSTYGPSIFRVEDSWK